ncbi:MAG: acyl-CoA dehydrogenase [Chitinophagales bacterium]|nr:acyl-CoA dehydrogenase [Chitinophagales bacterium]
MAKQYVSMRNLRFLLNEVFQAEQLTQYPYFAEHSRETFEMTLDAAKQIADTLLFPYYVEMDKDKPHYEDGTIKVHPVVKDIMKTFGEGGWINAPKPFEVGGQQMPLLVYNLAGLIFHSANTAAAAFPFLTAGAANLIDTFGTEELKAIYLDPMYSGKWQGTMALTEPQAGSSLSDITSTAIPNEAGYYTIKGQKIYISGGDHDAVENVVHLYLARIQGAPGGVKGISLFAVPKYRLENGQLVFNNVTTAGAYGKMGIKGAPIAHIMAGEQGECRGWLIGEPHRGLSYMFQMMNEARLGVGMISAGLASGAYYASLEYANERPQGRPLSNKDVNVPQSLIIEHADVKRMLLQQKAVVEGSQALIAQCSLYADIEHVATGEEKERANLLLELLTPIAKTFPAEMGIQSISNGLQVLGGAGFCDDFPLQQYYRDTRINPIYEGTTGIQALDLLGRKVPMKGGQALMLLGAEVQETLAKAKQYEMLVPYAEALEQTQGKLVEVTMFLMGLAQQDRPEVFLADATLYLEYFGYVVIGWQWLKQGVVAAEALGKSQSGDELHFYQGKIHTLKYYFNYELPKTRGLHARLSNNDKLTLEMPAEYLV